MSINIDTKDMESSGRVSAHSIKQWFPEDRQFWLSQGQYIAKRNLWISIPCLLLSFCVWMIFSAVAVNLPKVGFSFSTEQLFLLTALPSVSGAIGRIPYSFTISIFGGRRWTAFSTLMLVVPMVWLGIAISNPHTSYSTFVMIALLCGLGGANFASSMANISFFYPKEMQGSALGLNGGLGNLGVSVMQLVVPIAISVQWFTSQSEGPHLQNAAWIWVPLILLFSLISWFGMNDIENAKASFKEQVKVLK